MANTEAKGARTAKASAAETVKSAGQATKSAGDAASAFFTYPKVEFPEFFRSAAEQGMAQTREAYARMKSSAEEATDMIEESFETTRESMREVQFKALDMAKANTDATFELTRELLSTHSLSDALQLQAAFARERFEAYIDYYKDVQATVSKASADAAKPAKALFERSLKAAA